MKLESGTDASVAGVAPTADGEVELRAAALDAYRVRCLKFVKSVATANLPDIQRLMSPHRKSKT